MNTKEVDVLNIILIIISLTIAFKIPFELLLFSYAFFGPLHYLTEINWLREKKYFINNSKWVGFFLVLAFLLAVPGIIKLDLFQYFYSIPEVNTATTFLDSLNEELLITAILLAVGLLYFDNKVTRFLLLIPILTLIFYLLKELPTIALVISIFLPTLIHVYFFTLLFMIYGTIKTRNGAGIIAIILILIAPILIAISSVRTDEYFPLSEYVIGSFNTINLGVLTASVSKFILFNDIIDFKIYSPLGIKIQIFISFAYVYHYLNWFSKTSIIGWGKGISKSKLISILSIWFLSVFIYLFSYKLGFLLLLFLSLCHVFLELPLNIICTKEIIDTIIKKIVSLKR